MDEAKMTIKKMIAHYISACVLLVIVMALWNVNRTLAQIIGIASISDFVITFWKASRDAKRKKDWWQQEMMESLRISDKIRTQWEKEQRAGDKKMDELKQKQEEKGEFSTAPFIIYDSRIDF